MFHITHKEKVIGINIFENPALPEEIKLKIRDNEEVEFTFQYDFSKIKGYYESEKTSGFINLTTRITTLYDHDRQPINYLLINVDKTENTIAYNKIQEFKNFFELVGDYAKVGYAHFDALSRNGYALSSWYKNVGEEEGTPYGIIGIHSHFHPETGCYARLSGESGQRRKYEIMQGCTYPQSRRKLYVDTGECVGPQLPTAG